MSMFIIKDDKSLSREHSLETEMIQKQLNLAIKYDISVANEYIDELQAMVNSRY